MDIPNELAADQLPSISTPTISQSMVMNVPVDCDLPSLVTVRGSSTSLAAKRSSVTVTSADPGGHSNRERGRTCQTLRHGYRNTLRFFGFDDKDSIDLQKWMVEARDIKKWGPRVEETLGLDSGSFQSLYRAQNNFG